MLKKLALFSLVAFGFIACEPSEAGHTELGALPQADYSLTYIDSNTVQLVSNSSGDPFLFNWDIEGVGTYTGESVEVFIGTMGTYDGTHTVFNQGGSASANGQIEILKDGPMPCIGAMEWLTECSNRTWSLAQQAGEIWVGPDGNTTWWAIPATGPTDRPCLFNDEWIFSEDGTMEYDANGDVYAETYMGVAAEGCTPETNLTYPHDAWASGIHSFEIIPGNGPLPDQLKVNGLGAFIGIPKAANGGEVSSPVTSVTYDILSMTDVAGDRYMEIECDFGGGLWRFTLYSQS